uniref:38.7kd n=1 Tax=Cnaphalocrocis medinalis granulovirus TaxID=1750712 RepID=A0A0X9FCL9_9BBAC|nr:38.7kd [Cnaphalocrocis medinalis granulovirus]WPN08684.1 38.7k [Cnaphalocrocis medinalis granulovirus]
MCCYTNRLIVFIKPRIGNKTQLHYVTGETKEEFNICKNLYVNLEIVFDNNELLSSSHSPQEIIDIINKNLSQIEYVTNNCVIVNDYYENVKQTIINVINNIII